MHLAGQGTPTRTIVMISLGTALLLGATSGVAQASSSKPDVHATSTSRPPTVDEKIMLSQLPLDQAADQLRTIVDQQQLQGYTNTTVDPSLHRLLIRWKGNVPAALQTAAQQVRVRGIGVEFLAARYSSSELQAQISALVADERRRGVPVAYRGHTLIPAPDGSGLEVEVNHHSLTAEHARARFGVIRTIQATAATKATRLRDSAPFWGGARLGTPSGGCTSGFGVSVRGNANYMLTAAHCAAAGSRITNGAGTAIGYVSRRDTSTDSELISVSSSGSAVYDGAYNNSTGYHKPVVGRSGSNINNYVCTSGSYSGVRCSIKVNGTNLAVVDEGGNVTRGVVRAVRTDGTEAAGSGDSGGPVFSLATNTNQVIARGIMIAVSGPSVACTGVPASSARSCAATVYWTPISTALSAMGATLNLG